MDWVEVVSKLGNSGAFIVALILGIIYVTKWLRDTQDKFLAALESNRKENAATQKELIQEFKAMHAELGEKVDVLASKVEAYKK